MLTHAEMKRFHPSHSQEAVERAGHSTNAVLHKAETCFEVLRVGQHDAHYHIGVAIQVSALASKDQIIDRKNGEQSRYLVTE